jgi:hypothetical protein
MGAHRCLEDTGVGPSRAREERGDLSSRFCQLADEAREERERERDMAERTSQPEGFFWMSYRRLRCLLLLGAVMVGFECDEL